MTFVQGYAKARVPVHAVTLQNEPQNRNPSGYPGMDLRAWQEESNNGGCDACSGVVTVGPGTTVTRNAESYTLGHLARFVRPGAVRIASTSFGTTGWTAPSWTPRSATRTAPSCWSRTTRNDAPATVAVGYLRLELTERAPAWWSVADLRVYT